MCICIHLSIIQFLHVLISVQVKEAEGRIAESEQARRVQDAGDTTPTSLHPGLFTSLASSTSTQIFCKIVWKSTN